MLAFHKTLPSNQSPKTESKGKPGLTTYVESNSLGRAAMESFAWAIVTLTMLCSQFSRFWFGSDHWWTSLTVNKWMDATGKFSTICLIKHTNRWTRKAGWQDSETKLMVGSQLWVKKSKQKLFKKSWILTFRNQSMI